MIGEVQRNPSIALAERLHSHPHDLTRRHDGIQVGWIICADARRQDLGFENRGRERRPLKLLDRVEQRVRSHSPCPGYARDRCERSRRRRHALPRGCEAPEHRVLDRLDFVAQPREGAAAQHPQHAGVGPLAARAAGPELAFDQTTLGGEPHQQRLGRRRAQAVPRCEIKGGERRVRARVAQCQIAKRIAYRLQQRLGKADRQRHAERVAIARGVFDGDIPRLTGDGDRQHTARRNQHLDAGGDIRAQRAPAHLVAGEIANGEQHVVNPVGAPGAPCRFEPLQAVLDRLHRFGVEQVAQLRIAEQLAQLRLVDGKRLSPPLGERRVAVVEKTGDVGEQQRRGERRRRLRIDRGDADPAAADVGERAGERRHVEEVAQAFAVGFK